MLKNNENKLVDMIPETRDLFDLIDQIDADKLDKNQAQIFGRGMGEVQISVSGFVIDYVMFWKLIEIVSALAICLLLTRLFYSSNPLTVLSLFSVYFFVIAVQNVISLHFSRKNVVTTASNLIEKMKSFPRKS